LTRIVARVTRKPMMARVIWITRMPGITGMLNCPRCEPRSHLISSLSMIVQVIVVLNRTVVVDVD